MKKSEQASAHHLVGVAVTLAVAGMIALLACALLRSNPTPISVGQFTVTPSLGGSGMSAGYGTIRNSSDKRDRLLEVRFDGADRIELHETVSQNAIATMHSVALPLELAAGEELRFEPLTRHLMIFAKPGAFSLGDRREMTFVFENAGSVSTAVNVNYPAKG